MGNSFFCVGHSLLIVMLLARSAWWHLPGPCYYLWQVPPDMSPLEPMLWLDQPWSPYYDDKMHLGNNHQGALKR